MCPYVVEGIHVGSQTTVYIRDDDQELWARAEKFARARRVPMSGLIMLALQRYLDDEDG